MITYRYKVELLREYVLGENVLVQVNFQVGLQSSPFCGKRVQMYRINRGVLRLQNVRIKYFGVGVGVGRPSAIHQLLNSECSFSKYLNNSIFNATKINTSED